MKRFEIISVNTSEEKGTIKVPCQFIDLDGLGVVNDAHAGPWNRQVSLLAEESMQRFKDKNNRKVKPGEFAENITTKGIELHLCKPLDRFVSEDIILEVTQIGKKCHGSNCEIFKEVGNCVMPTEGIFCRVRKGGRLTAGDHLTHIPRRIKLKILTMSDRAHSGIYEDKSGEIIQKRMEAFFDQENRPVEIDKIILPDDSDMLLKHLIDAQNSAVDILFITGGTGIGPRDITPDVVKGFIDKEIPGIMELIRFKYGSEKPTALLSRSIAGVRGNILIYAIPGSTKAVEEYLKEILPTLIHSAYMVNGLDIH